VKQGRRIPSRRLGALKYKRSKVLDERKTVGKTDGKVC